MIPVSFESLIDFSNIRKGPSLSKRVLEYNIKQQYTEQSRQHTEKSEQSRQHTEHKLQQTQQQTAKPEEIGDIIDEEMECYKTTIDVDGDRKFVTTYFKNKNGKKIKRTREYRIEKRLVKMPKAVAERRKWTKFGQCAGQGPGIDHTTTISKEEVFIEWNIRGKIKDDNEEPKDDSIKTNILSAIGGKFTGIKCRNCGGPHMTHKCTSTQQPEEKKKSSNGKYTFTAKRREDFSIRITNFPEEVEEIDIRNLFNSFGYIKRINLNAQKGFCFVSFGNKESCLKAVEKVNRHRYGYHVLSVEMADNKKKK